MDARYVLVRDLQQVRGTLTVVRASRLMKYISFDATYLYQITFILLYNVVFTSLPVIALGGECSQLH